MKNLLNILLIAISIFSYGQNEASKLFKESNFAGAQILFEKHLQKDSNDFESLFGLASCEMKLENYHSAKGHFLKLVKEEIRADLLEPSLINLATCYRELLDFDSTKYYYELNIELFPNSSYGYYNYAQYHRSKGDFEETLRLYSRAILLDSMNTNFLSKRFEIFCINGEYQLAYNDLEKVLSINPSHLIVSNKAFCLTMLSRYSEADSLYVKTYKENLNNDIFLNNYGFNTYFYKDKKKGIIMIKKALEINYNNFFAHRNLAILYLKEDRNLKACEHIDLGLNAGFEKYFGNELTELKERFCK